MRGGKMSVFVLNEMEMLDQQVAPARPVAAQLGGRDVASLQIIAGGKEVVRSQETSTVSARKLSIDGTHGEVNARGL